MKKRVLLFGADGYDNVSVNMERAFRAIGHDAERFYYPPQAENKVSFLYRVLLRTPFQSKALRFFEDYKRNLGERYISKIKEYKPDLIFIIHFSSITGEQIRYITQTLGIPVAWWVMGDESLVSRYTPFSVDTYTFCTHLMMADISWLSTFRLLGDAKISRLPFAADTHLYMPLRREKKFDVSIIGNFSYNVSAVIQRIRIVERLCRDDFHVHAVAKGARQFFDRYPELRKLDLVDEFYLAPQVNEVYNQSQVILGINSPQAKSDPHVRVMEIAASGGFQIAEFRENTNELMEGTVVQFESLGELSELTAFYLAHETERKKSEHRAHELVLKKHTTTIRARQVIKEVFGL